MICNSGIEILFFNGQLKMIKYRTDPDLEAFSHYLFNVQDRDNLVRLMEAKVVRKHCSSRTMCFLLGGLKKSEAKRS